MLDDFLSIVSIAEAILWGEQPDAGGSLMADEMFQSQRRFFGGSNPLQDDLCSRRYKVSIAEAILWGEQPNGEVATPSRATVSIAEAILWGEQPQNIIPSPVLRNCFNRRGDSLGGATQYKFS